MKAMVRVHPNCGSTEQIHDFYLSDTYLEKHPSLHVEDSLWKFLKMAPLLEKIEIDARNEAITLLDVGGGAGVILSKVSTNIQNNKNVRIRKIALDLSPGALKLQKENNPDLEKMLNEDICKTSLKDKEIDLTLMIDVLEHIPEPIRALEELRRISKFIIFKVPLEHNLSSEIANLIRRGKSRQDKIEILGHINFYDLKRLKKQIQEHCGTIIDSRLTNYFQYLRNLDSSMKLNTLQRLQKLVAPYLFLISPKTCSYLFFDFALLFVRCY